MKKIVFFDIDGTLYEYFAGIPEDTRRAIKKLRENGHIPIICTGRTRPIIFDDILELGFDGIIAGAGTYLEYKNKLIYQNTLEEDLVTSIISDMRKYGIMPIAEGIEHIYFNEREIPEDYAQVYRVYKENVPNKIIDLKEDTKVLASKVSGKINKDSNILEFMEIYKDKFNFVIHGDILLEMIPIQFSKAVGIERLINYLGIDRDNTYAFGDSMNDFEMLKYVNYGVAMGNSSEEFKNAMKYVTEDYDKGGIYNGLKRFGLI